MWRQSTGDFVIGDPFSSFPLVSSLATKKKEKGKGGHEDAPRIKRSGADSDKHCESTLKGNLVRVGVKGRMKQK